MVDLGRTGRTTSWSYRSLLAPFVAAHRAKIKNEGVLVPFDRARPCR